MHPYLRTPLRCMVIFWLLLSLPTAFAATASPQFSNFPAEPVYSGATAPLNLISPEAREFRSRLTEAAREKINFNGHYIMTSWGCGSGCSMYAVIDAKSGKVFIFPFTVTSMGPGEQDPVTFRKDSSLVIVHGALNETAQEGTYYYKWSQDKLQPLR